MQRKINGAWLVAALVLATFAISGSAQGQETTPWRTTPVAAGKKGLATSNIKDRLQGFMLGVHSVGAAGVTLSGGAFDDPYKTGSGTGAGFSIGYGFNERFTSYFSLDVAKQKPSDGETEGSFGLGHFEVGVRAALPVKSMQSTVPYVSASFGRRGLGAHVTDEDGNEGDISFHGRMYGLGVGIEHFFSPTMSIDGGLQLAFGKFDHLKVDSHELDLEVNGTRSTRLRLGVNWRP